MSKIGGVEEMPKTQLFLQVRAFFAFHFLTILRDALGRPHAPPSPLDQRKAGYRVCVRVREKEKKRHIQFLGT